MYATDYKKKTYHKVVVFSTCVYLMHHGGNMEKILWWKFAINDGLHLNLSLCCEIGPHMNNIIINWNIFLICNNVDSTL